MKKNYSNETIHFHRKYEFYLSPSEFLDMVWVYRKEIKPRLNAIKAVTEKKPENFKNFLIEVRGNILNGEFIESDLKAEELAFFERVFRKVFTVFENAVDEKISTPDPEKINSARNSFADLLHTLGENKFPELSSNMNFGNIVFQVTEVTNGD